MSAGASTRRFLYDQDAMVAEYDGAGAMLRRYLHGPGVDDPLAWYEGAGLTDRRALHADERGSIIAVTDATGNSLAINAYDEYGRPQTRPIANGTPGAITSNALTGTFGYTGQIWLPEIKAYYYKARMYDPKGGRFYQVDPIGYDGGNNLYEYANSNPINLSDPEGKAALVPIALGVRCALNAPCRTAVASTGRWLIREGVKLGTSWMTNDGPVFPDKKRGGIIDGDLPEANDIGDKELEPAICELDTSIKLRTEEMRDAKERHFRKGGSPHDPKFRRDRDGHQERIRREETLKEELRRRQGNKEVN